MHLKRWLTAIVALPFLLLLIFKGGRFLFLTLIGTVSVVALLEYFRIVYDDRETTSEPIHPKASARPNRTGGVTALKIVACLAGLLILWSVFIASEGLMFSVLALCLVGFGLLSIPMFKSNSLIFESIAKQILGIVYIPLLLSFLVLIRSDPNGAWWIFSFLFIIFAGDTGAFYVGTYLGRHKLCPWLSPGKTIEGAFGGLAANLALGALLKSFFLPDTSWGLCLVFCISIGLAGQIGDLFESAIKRSAHIKDSGAILPGHGGILDRIDALLFAAPVAYVLKTYML